MSIPSTVRSAPIAVVTGGSSGIGRATALEFAEAGYDIALIARGEEALLAAQAEVLQRGRRCLTLPCDVSDAAAVDAAAARIEAELGPVAVWINNAAVTQVAPFLETEPAEFERVMAVTYLGQVNGTRAALRRMAPRNRGVIALVGSAVAYRGIPLQSAYSGAKFALRGFAEALRCELLHDGTRVTVVEVHPPSVNTPLYDNARGRHVGRPQPVRPVYQPEAVARAIRQAVEGEVREMWVGGATVGAAVGNMLAPALLDRVLARQGYRDQQGGGADTVADNLDRPVGGRLASHGRFDDEARATAVAVPADLLRVAAGAAFVGAAALTQGLGLVASLMARAVRRP